MRSILFYLGLVSISFTLVQQVQAIECSQVFGSNQIQGFLSKISVGQYVQFRIKTAWGQPSNELIEGRVTSIDESNIVVDRFGTKLSNIRPETIELPLDRLAAASVGQYVRFRVKTLWGQPSNELIEGRVSNIGKGTITVDGFGTKLSNIRPETIELPLDRLAAASVGQYVRFRVKTLWGQPSNELIEGRVSSIDEGTVVVDEFGTRLSNIRPETIELKP